MNIKESLSVNHFKKDIKFWNFTCNCRLCKSYIVNLGLNLGWLCCPLWWVAGCRLPGLPSLGLVVSGVLLGLPKGGWGDVVLRCLGCRGLRYDSSIAGTLRGGSVFAAFRRAGWCSGPGLSLGMAFAGAGALAGAGGRVTINSMILIRFSCSCCCINYGWH